MKNLIVILTALFTCVQTPCFAGNILSEFFAAQHRPGVRWILHPVALQSWMEVTKAPDGTFQSTALTGTGGGISYQRTVYRDSANYSTFSFSLVGIFADAIQASKYVKFSGAITIGILDNLIGGGIRYNGKEWSGLICTTINLSRG
jgi:hypothetical protein